MSNWKKFFEGKRVTQLGLGLLGRGIKDADFLATYCKELIVTDKKDEQALTESVSQLSHHSNISFHLGGHSLDDFKNRDFILKGAGVPLASEEVLCAQAEGIPVYMDESLFFELMPQCTFVAVTGTRGKTTTTMLLHHIVAHAYASRKNVFLAGNIKEVATLPMLEIAKDGDIVVAEMSSWQLQGFGSIKKSPHISIMTNFLSDHLNYYPDMQTYFNDKAFIFSNQTKEDTLICTRQAAEQINTYFSGELRSNVIMVDPAQFELFISASPLIGAHNRENISCAVAAAQKLGIDDQTIIAAVRTFTGAPGRLEKVGDFSGITVYNDTTSTTPDALNVALDAFPEKQKLILISGGADKGLDFSSVIPKMAQAKYIILTPGNGSARIGQEVVTATNAAGTQYMMAASTADAVLIAKEAAQPGDTILFSPSFSSFAEFKNEYDRGDSFLRFVDNVFKQS